MKPIPPDHFQRRARDFYARIDEIHTRLVSRRVVLDPMERNRIQEMTRALKEDLRADVKWAESERRTDSLSAQEQAAVSSIRQTLCTLDGFKVNTDPTEWTSAFANAISDLSDYMPR